MFDLNTLRLISMFCYIGFVFTALMLWRAVPQEPSLREWSIAALLTSLGLLLMGLRGNIPDFISVVIANSLMVLGAGFMYVATRSLFAVARGPAWQWLAAGVTFLVCIFAPSITERVITSSIFYALFFLLSAIWFWHKGDSRLRATKRVTAVIFAAGAILFSLRAMNPPNIAASVPFISSHKWIEAMPYLYTVLFSSWVPLTLMLIVSGRLQLESQASSDRADEALRELQKSDLRWKFAIEGSGDGVWDCNVQTDEAHYSKRWKEILGYSDDEILSTNEEWSSRIHAEDRDRVAEAMQAYLEDKTEIYAVEYRLRCKDGSYKWILGRGMLVSHDQAGKPLRMVGTHTDISTRKQMETQIIEFAFYDALTKLPNRRLLTDRLLQEMAKSKRTASYGALIFLDLDHFKPLNDTHGHAAGDLLLIEAACRLKACVREVDTLARMGGDEFVVLLTQLSPDAALSKVQAKKVAEIIRLALSAPYPLQVGHDGIGAKKINYRCSASLGVALFVGDKRSQEDVIKRADDAMYQAKNAGRDQVCFYGESI
jgi:diguanylate cyclase (GGDEF)-like protein/PAS domain S-box-containing protein